MNSRGQHRASEPEGELRANRAIAITESVTHVLGQLCYPCPRLLTLDFARPAASRAGATGRSEHIGLTQSLAERP